MLLLNILMNSDGTFAWDNVLLLLLALIAGYLLHRYTAKKSEDNKYATRITESEAKYKKLDNEFKNYKSNISSSDKQNEKSVVQLGGRVKSLEGDIRVLSDEKNKLHHLLLSKEEDLKKYSRQISELEDNLKVLHENKMKGDAESADKIKAAKEELARAAVWEKRVRSAEEEAERAKSAIGNAERKKLEAELRLKATAEYAGKVGPMEAELKSLQDQIALLESTLKTTSGSSDEVMSALKTTSAQLELERENNKTLQQEFQIKHAANISLGNEIEYLKTAMSKIAAENVMLKSKMNIAAVAKTDEKEQAV
jgi:chromosome segregation ATPase